MAIDGNSRDKPKRVISAMRRQQVLELRRTGMTYQEIGEQLGITRQAVGVHVHKALDQLNVETIKEAELLRTQLSDRLDVILAASWDGAKSGDPRAIDTTLRVLDRMARLHGLDAPVRIAPVTPDGTGAYSPPPSTPDATFAEIVAILERGRAEPSASSKPTPIDFDDDGDG